MTLVEFLKEWVTNYVKSRDVMKQTVVEIEKDVKEIIVTHKHKEVKYFIDPFLENLGRNLEEIKMDSDACVVCLNTKENLKKVLESWKDLVLYRHLAILFANPFSKTDKSWSVFPYTHNRISDFSALKPGLNTMFEQVEEADKDEINKMYDRA